MYIYFNLQVTVQEDYQIYPIDSFFADVGGYLGLLLGASMFSLIESSIDVLEKMFNKNKPDLQ